MTIEVVKITPDQAQAFRQSHRLAEEESRKLRTLLWKAIKETWGLPAARKYKVDVQNIDSSDYRVVKDKVTGLPVGAAKSHTPYGCAPIANVIPFLAVNWDARKNLPPNASPIGGGMFVHEEQLYFPIY